MQPAALGQRVVRRVRTNSRGRYSSGVRRSGWGEGTLGLGITPPADSESPPRQGAVSSPWGPPCPAPLCRLWFWLRQSGFPSPDPDALTQNPPRASLTDVFGPDGHRPAQLGDELLGIQADLDDVVQQREQRGEGEGCHKQGDEAKLDDCGEREPSAAPPGRGCPPPRELTPGVLAGALLPGLSLEPWVQLVHKYSFITRLILKNNTKLS